jgi:hypothetical protein
LEQLGDSRRLPARRQSIGGYHEDVSVGNLIVVDDLL